MANQLTELFLEETNQTPEHFLMDMDLFALMVAKRHGNRMLIEATKMFDGLKGTGDITINDIKNDIRIINENLTKISKAYNLAMN